jgi:hypothetical protein
MEIGRRIRRLVTLRDVPVAALGGGPHVLKRCDALGCESSATEHCSAHGVHFCQRHFEHHRTEWHLSSWEAPLRLARC